MVAGRTWLNKHLSCKLHQKRTWVITTIAPHVPYLNMIIFYDRLIKGRCLERITLGYFYIRKLLSIRLLTTTYRVYSYQQQKVAHSKKCEKYTTQ